MNVTTFRVLCCREEDGTSARVVDAMRWPHSTEHPRGVEPLDVWPCRRLDELSQIYVLLFLSGSARVKQLETTRNAL